MFPKCEVDGCEDYAEHTFGLGTVTSAVCGRHRDEAREILKKYTRELLEARMDIYDKFLNDIRGIKEEE